MHVCHCQGFGRKSLPAKRLATGFAWIFGLLLFFGGCHKAEEISLYSVPKPPPPVKPTIAGRASGVNPADSDEIDSVAEPGQILGAIVPRGSQTWFFKLTGPSAAVLAKIEPYLEFIKSLRFEGQTPRWTLPEGWSEEPGNQFRHATIVIETPTWPLELTVSALPSADGSFDDYLLSNINRWRGQLQTPPIGPEQLSKATLKQDIGDISVWLVNIEGQLGGEGMGGRPAAAAAARPPGQPPKQSGDAPTGKSPSLPPLPFEFTTPEGWSRKSAGPMRLAEFEVRNGAQRVTISVSTAGGDMLANVNRWRGQIGLQPLMAAELPDSLRKIKVGNLKGDYAELVGPANSEAPQTILGVVVKALGQQWFFKLQGDANLGKQEQPRFEQFVQSIWFRGTEGDSDGR